MKYIKSISLISRNQIFFVFSLSLKKKFSNEQTKTMHENENSSSNQIKIIIKNRNDMKNIENFQKQNFLKNFAVIDERNNMKKINNIETYDNMKNVKIIIESIDQLIRNDMQQSYAFEMISKSLNNNNEFLSNTYLQLYMNICIMN